MYTVVAQAPIPVRKPLTNTQTFGNLRIPFFPIPQEHFICPPTRKHWREGCLCGRRTGKPSPRQQRVIEPVAKGLKNREIAKKLGIAEHVVRNYLGIIFDKVGVRNRVELALWYEARLHERRFQEKK